MKGPLREVYEIVAEGDNVTYRTAYYLMPGPNAPVAVLDVFVKKSRRGIATPAVNLDRIRTRLTRIKEIEQ
jgi:phage-related protein